MNRRIAAEQAGVPIVFLGHSMGSFLGRRFVAEYSDALAGASLAAGQEAAGVGRVLHGLGGVGKTRLAVEYAWLHEAEYSALLFVRANDPAALAANLGALAGEEVLDLKEKDAPENEDRSRAEVARGPCDLADDY